MKPGFDFQRILEMRDVQPGFFMAALYFHALAAIAVSLSVLIEMFAHMTNSRELMTRVRAWLKSDGRLFLQG